MTDSADRELRAEITIAAPPAEVWAALIDLKRLPSRSPELLKMVALKPGGLKVGQQYIGFNKRKAVIWPSRSAVAVVEPERALAWDTKSSGARWIYELSAEGTGTRVVQRRPVPRRLTLLGRVWANAFLGGMSGRPAELEAGMVKTLARLKADLEG